MKEPKFDFAELYSQVKDTIKKTYNLKNKKDLMLMFERLEIAQCVILSLTEEERKNKKLFNAICDYCLDTWYRIDNFYVQLMTDIVAECYRQSFSENPEASVTLTLDDLLNFRKIDNIVEIYQFAYFDD